MKTIKLLLLILFTILFCKNCALHILTLMKPNSTIQPLCDNSLYTIDIYGGTKYENKSYEFEGVLYPEGTYFYKTRNIEHKTFYVKGCICLVRKCLMICTSFEYVTNEKVLFNYKQKVKCNYFFSNTNNNTEVQLMAIERLLKTNNGIQINQNDEFCTIVFPNKYKQQHCYVVISNFFDGVCLFISIGLSAAILIVFTIITELRNLNGKLIMCYVLAKLIQNIIALVMNNILYIRNFYFAYFLYFEHINILFWSNAICYDIWSTFG